MKEYPRVLIISHNALSDTQSNGKTISAFFKQWNYDNIAQIYLTTDLPDFTISKKFFQINDFDILKRALFQKNIQGRRIVEEDILEMKGFKEDVIKNPLLSVIRNNINPIFRFFRDILWSIGGFKTRELRKFIDEFDPQIVLFHASNGIFAFNLTKWICESKGIPLIIQSTDDYVSSKFTLDPFYWIQYKRLLKIYKWAYSYANCIIAIGEKMANEYKYRFGGNYYVAMNSISTLHLPKYKPRKGKTKFLYAGNLHLDRWRILGVIADCLKELESENIFAELNIYSLVPPENNVLNYIHLPPYSFFKGSINTEELNSVKKESDILVHVEAFDKKNRHITRLSISTKIPEYLASGRCIFAIGPNDVASMEYLAENDLGVTINTDDKESIKAALKNIIVNDDIRCSYADNGVEVASLNHNIDVITNDMYDIITNAINSNKVNSKSEYV